MKIKPLLKTHWLASQNPMNVSLGGLTKLVFTPPESCLDFSYRNDLSKEQSIISISEVKKLLPEISEIQDILSRSHTLSRDLFWTLFSGHDLLPLKLQSQVLRDLVNSIEFHFENGEAYSLVGIFRKPDFPVFLNPQFYLQDRSCHWEKVLNEYATDLVKPLKAFAHQKKSDDFKKTWVVIVEIIAWALQRKRQVGDLEVLMTESQKQENLPQLRQAFPIEDLEFVKSRPLKATILADSLVKNSARVSLWQGHELSEFIHVLRLHSVHPIQEEAQKNESEIYKSIISEDVNETHEYNLVAEGQVFKWSRVHIEFFNDAKSVLNYISKLNTSVSKDNIFYCNHKHLNKNSIKTVLRLKETEGSLQIAVGFKLLNEHLVHLNFPYSMSSVFQFFNGGLERFFSLDRKDYASKQSQFRQNDLMILRHQGLVFFCMLEMINWMLQKPLTSGKIIEYTTEKDSPEFDKGFDELIKYLKDSIPGILGKSVEKFEFMFSSEVKNLFLDFMDKLFLSLRDDHSLFFQNGNIYEIKDVQEKVLNIVRFLILHWIEESGGKFLLKSQSTVGEKLLTSLKTWADGQIITEDLYTKGYEPQWVDIGLYSKYVIHMLFDLLDQEVEIEFNGVPFLSKDNPFEFVFAISETGNKEDSNWFDLHPKIFFNGTRVAVEDVKLNLAEGEVGFIEYQGQIYRIDKKQIPTLKSLQKFWNKIKGLKSEVNRNSFGDKVYRLEKSISLELLMLRSQGIHVEAEGDWLKIFEYFESGLGSEKIQLSEVIKSALLPHQSEGAQWLYDLYHLKLGAILADEMGLGKTFQVLAFLQSLSSMNKLTHSLIVVPTSLVYNWIDEKKKFAPDLPFLVFQSAEKQSIMQQLQSSEPVILLTTYGLLNENRDFFEAIRWNILAFDEAQNLKNITSVRSVSARKLKADFKICLTGTPMENHYLEFYSLCDLVVPGCLGDVDDFRRKYYNQDVRTESLRDLKLITRPLLLRRTKEQVKLSLPVKIIQKVVLPFSQQQKEVYKKMAMTFSKQVDDLIQQQGERKAQIAMFSALMRLRQICSDPAAVPGVIYKDRPVKVEHLMNSLHEHLENNESVIIFTQFLSTLGRIENELIKENIPVYTLQGRVNAKERIRLISQFQQNDKPSVMLMTLKTGGVGLNLTKASVVYHLEPWWNPAVENQATDRAHRMGQTKDVKVFNLLIEGSLEERIQDLKIKKQGSFDRLFSMEEQIDESVVDGSNSLSKEDFLYLLK